MSVTVEDILAEIERRIEDYGAGHGERRAELADLSWWIGERQIAPDEEDE